MAHAFHEGVAKCPGVLPHRGQRLSIARIYDVPDQGGWRRGSKSLCNAQTAILPNEGLKSASSKSKSYGTAVDHAGIEQPDDASFQTADQVAVACVVSRTDDPEAGSKLPCVDCGSALNNRSTKRLL